jgi:hypothetical protein
VTRQIADPSLVIAAVFLLALSILTLALIVLKRIARNEGVLRGHHVDNKDEDR